MSFATILLLSASRWVRNIPEKFSVPSLHLVVCLFWTQTGWGTGNRTICGYGVWLWIQEFSVSSCLRHGLCIAVGRWLPSLNLCYEVHNEHQVSFGVVVLFIYLCSPTRLRGSDLFARLFGLLCLLCPRQRMFVCSLDKARGKSSGLFLFLPLLLFSHALCFHSTSNKN